MNRTPISRSTPIVFVLILFSLYAAIEWTNILRWPEYLTILIAISGPVSFLIYRLLALRSKDASEGITEDCNALTSADTSDTGTSSTKNKRSLLYLLLIAAVFADRLLTVSNSRELLSVIVYLTAAMLLLIFIRFFWPGKKEEALKDNVTIRNLIPNSDITPHKHPSFLKRIALFPLTAILIIFILLTNRWWDNSIPQEITVPIVKKYTDKDKHGNISYHTIVDSLVPSPLPFAFGNSESFSESDVSYRLNVEGLSFESIAPGISAATFKIHKGYWDIPWYEAKYKIRNTNIPTTPESNRKTP